MGSGPKPGVQVLQQNPGLVCPLLIWGATVSKRIYRFFTPRHSEDCVNEKMVNYIRYFPCHLLMTKKKNDLTDDVMISVK